MSYTVLKRRAAALTMLGLLTWTVPTITTAHAFETSTPSASPKRSTQSSPTTPSTAPRRPTSNARKSDKASKDYTTGIAAAKARKYEIAIPKLSAAISGGGLPIKQTARALLYRGIAYRKTGQAAKAIADFTGALWKRGALSAKETALAKAQRKAAFETAGVSGAAAPTASRKPTKSPKTDRSGGSPTPPKQWATIPVRSGNTTPARNAQGGWQTAPTSKPAKSGQGKSFFESLFGGGQQTTKPAPQSKLQPRSGAPKPWRTGSITTGSTVSSKPAPQLRKRAVPRKRPNLTGRYRIQVAALRNRTDAIATIDRITSSFGKLLGPRTPSVEKGVMGNMGTMYQVRIGPFKTPAATRRLCNKLIQDGLDCLVLKR